MFELISTSAGARSGRLHTRRGVIETPVFMPVGTVGSVKALDATDLKNCGATVMLANTYHLLLRPGAELIARRGGLHKFTNSDLPVLTDSGGFQVMSLSEFRTLSDDGVTFRSHLDGSTIRLSPEDAVRIQGLIGSDIQMVLDVCPPHDASMTDVRRATELSHKWAQRSLHAEKPDGVLRFGIAQGGMDAAMRADSTAFIGGLGFDGVAIGGLSVGESQEIMFSMLEAALPHAPEAKPRYLMGVGLPSQIVHAVSRGVDMFDCVLPTRVARHGTLWTSRGHVRINRAEYGEDDSPVDGQCSCLACARYSRAYLRHLYRVKDPLYYRLASLHNLTYLLSLMTRIREAIACDSFGEILREFTF